MSSPTQRVSPRPRRICLSDKPFSRLNVSPEHSQPAADGLNSINGILLTFFSLDCSPRRRRPSARCDPQKPADEDQEDAEGPSCKDLCDALVNRPEASCFGVAGRQAHHLGRIHHKQGSRYSPSIIMGHDLRLRPERKLRRLRRSRQHLLHLQSQLEP